MKSARAVKKTDSISSDLKRLRMQKWFLLFIGFCGVVTVLACTVDFGVGVTPDSAVYAGMAESLLDGDGFLNCNFGVDGKVPVVEFPFLYPGLLAVFKIVGVDYFDAARYISAVSYGAVIFLSGLLALRLSKSFVMAILCSVAIVFSRPLFHIHTMAWTETLFVSMIMLSFWSLIRFVEDNTFGTWLVLSLAVGAACVTRYIGVFMIPAAGLFLLLYLKRPFLKRLLVAAGFGFTAAIPIVGWLIRNYVLTGTLTGPRYLANISLWHNLILMENVMAKWILPTAVIDVVPNGVLLGLLLVLVLAGCVKGYHNIFTIFVIIYSIAILYATTATVLTPLDDRYLSPLYAPLALLFCIGAAKLYRLTKGKTALRLCVIGVVCLFSGTLFVTGGSYVWKWGQRVHETGGWGARNAYWRSSEIVTGLKSMSLDGQIYTNNGEIIYVWTGVRPKHLPISSIWFNSSPKELQQQNRLEVEEFKRDLQTGDKIYMVWFWANHRPHILNPNQLQDFCNMQIVRKFNDGVIVRLFPKQ